MKEGSRAKRRPKEKKTSKAMTAAIVIGTLIVSFMVAQAIGHFIEPIDAEAESQPEPVTLPTPAGDVGGKWSGQMELVEILDDRICLYSGQVSLEVDQTGDSVYAVMEIMGLDSEAAGREAQTASPCILPSQPVSLELGGTVGGDSVRFRGWNSDLIGSFSSGLLNVYPEGCVFNSGVQCLVDGGVSWIKMSRSS